MAVELPRPVLKWAGGKTASIPAILRFLPKKIDTYYEPFFGGGAVFFALARENRFERAVIADTNPELIITLTAIRDDVEGVIAAIKRLGPAHVNAKKYYRVRASKPRTASAIAARMLFLNKTGYNGLYRVNLRGGFNVPHGKDSKGKPISRWKPDFENIVAVSACLRTKQVEIRCQDFEELDKQLVLPLGTARDLQDAGYFDPPYLPESKTAKFDAYTPGGFSVADHRRLGKVFERWASRGVCCVASNAAVRGAERIYEDIPGTEILEAKCRRGINSNGKRRGAIGELLIVNPGRCSGESRENV